MKLKGLPKLSKRAIVINSVAGVVMLSGFVSLIHSTFARPYFEVCTSRYHRQQVMTLDREGKPLTPTDIQAVSNGLDEGVIENLSIAAFQGGPTKFAMGVKIAADTVEQRSGRGTPGGVSFPWAPSTIEQPQAACLSYNVFLPADFDFGTGGTLPGLFGTTTNGQFGDKPNFQTQLSWLSGGAPRFYMRTMSETDNRSVAFKTWESALPRGRWVRVDQEIVMNTPKQADGVARLWFDGKLEIEVKSVDVRDNTQLAIAGVASEVYFGGSDTNGKAAKDSQIWLSPFEIRWN
jgi:hypothetical protein